MPMKHRRTRGMQEDAEWNFDPRRLPDSEVEACFFYEYAREFAKGSPDWPPAAGVAAPRRAPRRGSPRNGSLFDAYLRRASLFENLPRVHVLLPLFVADEFVTTPWTKVAAALRQKAALALEKRTPDLSNWPEHVCLKITLERDLPEYKDCGVEDFPGWKMLDLSHHLGRGDQQREYGFFAINWSFTDTRLKDEFAKFLAEKRGDRKDVKNRRGTNKMRQHLRALGAKRLLEAGLTPNEAYHHTGDLHTGDGENLSPLYGLAPSLWLRAKSKATKVMNGLFPPARRRPA